MHRGMAHAPTRPTLVVQGRTRQTTIAGQHTAQPVSLVPRRFTADRPDRLWVADFTYVPTWSSMVYVAFVIDVYSRRILGWRAATSMKTTLVLDALEMAIWARGRHGTTNLTGLIHHHDAGSQYTSIAFTERLAAAGATANSRPQERAGYGGHGGPLCRYPDLPMSARLIWTATGDRRVRRAIGISIALPVISG